MTVRVIGSDKKKLRRIVCENCASKLEYAENDIRYYHTSHVGENCTDGWIKCAGCGGDVLVKCGANWI